jgi:Replication-relaxation
MAGRLLPRDFAALTTIGVFRMLTRLQLKSWHFVTVSDTVVRRFIDRVVERGFAGTERINRNGVQVVWLTQAGADWLVDHAPVSRDDLFPARGPVPAKDFAHTSAIVDAALAVERRGFRADLMLPAWALQRAQGGRADVFPDLLCLTRASDTKPGAALAVEVDFGGEPIGSVLVPKTEKLAAFLAPYSGSTLAILLLTVGSRRRSAIEQALRKANISVPIAVEELDKFTAETVRSKCSDEEHLEEGEAQLIQ